MMARFHVKEKDFHQVEFSGKTFGPDLTGHGRFAPAPAVRGAAAGRWVEMTRTLDSDSAHSLEFSSSNKHISQYGS
jgi:hypothetical protein